MKKIFLALFVVGCFTTLCFAEAPATAPAKDTTSVVEKSTADTKAAPAKATKKAKKKGKKVNKKAAMKAKKEAQE